MFLRTYTFGFLVNVFCVFAVTFFSLLSSSLRLLLKHMFLVVPSVLVFTSFYSKRSVKVTLRHVVFNEHRRCVIMCV